jgi:hypothetical protein
MNARSMIILLLILSSCSSSKKKELSGVNSFSNEKAIELISLLEIDPRPELPVYVVIGEKLNRDVSLVTVCQSKSRSRSDFVTSFKYRGHDVFIYDLSREKIDQMFFDTDAPYWRIMVSSSSGSNRYFLMESLTPVVERDSAGIWRLN